MVARNVLATLVTQVVSWGLTFAVTLYLPRYLGDTGLGKLSFALSVAAVYGVFVPLGTSTVLIKEIARDRSRIGELLWGALLLRVGLGLLGFAVLMPVGALSGLPGSTQTLVGVVILVTLVSHLNDALGVVLQGQENIPRQSLAVVVEKFAVAVLTLAIIAMQGSILLIAAVPLVSCTFGAIVSGAPFWSVLRQVRVPSWATLRFLVVAGLPFMGWNVFRTLYGHTDPLILTYVAGEAAAGWYSAASRLIGTALFFPAAVTGALLPTLTRLYASDVAGYAGLTRRMFSWVMLAGVPAALLLICLPDRVIGLLRYPAGFDKSIPVLQMGGLGLLGWYAAMVLGTAIIASDGHAKMFRVSVIATLVGIPGCIVASYLTHRWSGNAATGAMLSDVLLELFLFVAYARMLPAGILDWSVLQSIARPAAAAIPMAALLWWTAGTTEAVYVIGLCVLAYGAGCWLFRCVGAGEFAALTEILSRQKRQVEAATAPSGAIQHE